MSIAVSAIVSPSRVLRTLLTAYGLAHLAAGFAVGLAAPERYLLPRCSALLLGLAGALLLHRATALAKTRRIDISGVGELRLTVQQDIGTRGAAPLADGARALLLPGTTVWPRLLMLRLRSEDGKELSLPVLPDSVADEVFRALAVAVGAIGGRNKRLPAPHKIL